MFKNAHTKSIIAWAMYDWANSAFATVVIAGFFPIFFKQHWSPAENVTESTFQLGLINSMASLLLAFFAPLLGAVADKAGARKKFLLFFAMTGVVMTGALNIVAQGYWEVAVVIYMIAVIGFSGANLFYDALIVDVAKKEEMDQVSALGYALGYLGGGLVFASTVVMTLWPQYFGLANAAEAIRMSFICVAVWWALFSIPLFVFVTEKPSTCDTQTYSSLIKGGFLQLAATFREVRKLKVVFLFILAYWFYIDGVNTIMRMAVDYGLSLGIGSNDLIVALLITQFVGFPASLAFGKLGRHLGAKTGIYVAIFIYIVITIWAAFMQEAREFYVLAIMIGLVQGGIQSLSRSFYTSLIPANKSAEFFGFYNMCGKFAAIMGPFAVGWLGLVTGNPRYSVLAITVLFILGAVFLFFVNQEEGERLGQDL